jgi:hypothetical protein
MITSMRTSPGLRRQLQLLVRDVMTSTTRGGLGGD